MEGLTRAEAAVANFEGAYDSQPFEGVAVAELLEGKFGGKWRFAHSRWETEMDGANWIAVINGINRGSEDTPMTCYLGVYRDRYREGDYPGRIPVGDLEIVTRPPLRLFCELYKAEYGRDYAIAIPVEAHE